MSYSPVEQRELQELLHALCEESLDAAGEARLTELLANHEEARMAYIETIDMHANMAWKYGTGPQSATVFATGSDGKAGLGPDDDGLPGEQAPQQPVKVSSVLGFLGDAGGQTWDYFSDNKLLFSVLALIVIACTIIFWKVEGGIGFGERGTQVAEHKSEMPSPPARLASPSLSVARLARSTDCKWVNPASAPAEGAMLTVAQTLQLTSGCVEIVFRSGAEVRLRGPAIFQIESANSGFLTIGRLTARAATPQAHGFTIHSRTASALDLGTEFEVTASSDGHSQFHVISGAVELQLVNGQSRQRLNKGQTLEVEPGNPAVTARIEPGDDTPGFQFPTIEPPSAHDFADASRHHATIRMVGGKPHFRSGPIDVLLDGQGQSTADSPKESFFFADDEPSGLILLDLGRTIGVGRVNTYSWHRNLGSDRDRNRAVQKYYLYGAGGSQPPTATGDLAAHGWTLIARVNTDEFFGMPSDTAQFPSSVKPGAARPAQQGVSIAAEQGPIGNYRYLLWDIQPTTTLRADVPVEQNAFYSEFDVYAENEL